MMAFLINAEEEKRTVSLVLIVSSNVKLRKLTTLLKAEIVLLSVWVKRRSS
jgi:hypothetical protein